MNKPINRLRDFVLVGNGEDDAEGSREAFSHTDEIPVEVLSTDFAQIIRLVFDGKSVAYDATPGRYVILEARIL